MNTYIGIDPGLDGALAIIRDGHLQEIYDTPTLKPGKRRQLDLGAMVELLEPLREMGGVRVALERVHSFPGQGVASMFSLGYGLGAWEMALAAMRLPYVLVLPQEWRRLLLAGYPPPETKKERKVQAVQHAIKIFPAMAKIFRGPKGGMVDGRADAALLAEYARLKA